MDAISHALRNLRFCIPPEIINLVFAGGLYRTRFTTSIDDNIMTTVMYGRVLFDIDLVGGTEVFIPLDGIPVERQNDYTSIYRIPMSKTDGRRITSALNITFSDPSKVSSYGVAAGDQNTTMLQGFESMMDALGSMPVTSTAYVQLIAVNTVMVRDTLVLPANSYLRCRLANDVALSHIQVRSFNAFAELVEQATKSYIHNQKIIGIDKAELSGGQELGRIKEVIDSYADAEQLYREQLKRWGRINMMNDRETWQRDLRMYIGGRR